MADVTRSSVCSNTDAATGVCMLHGHPCPHSPGDAGHCPDATFLARVSMPPDEFVIVLNAAGQPTLGTVSVVRCRRPEQFHNAAGVHVNAVLETAGDEMLLHATWRLDGAVEFHCPATDVRLLWRDGKFIPL